MMRCLLLLLLLSCLLLDLLHYGRIWFHILHLRQVMVLLLLLLRRDFGEERMTIRPLP